jgi:hypothetical protein
MAFSGSQNINQYAGINLYTPDFQLISTALTAKQQKLDTNRAKLQSYRDQLGLSLDVAKESDQKYIDDRLSQLTAMTNQYASMDLSNDGLTQSLMSNLGQVIDGNVKNAVTSTKILQSEQAEWSDKRKNKPELYAEKNYRFAMQKANNWMNDDTVGTAYNGGGGFIEYVDYSAMIQKSLPDIQKALEAKGKRIETNGLASNTIMEVNRQDMADALKGILSGKAKQQMEIDAWDTYDKLPPETLKAEWESHITPKIEEFNDKIDALKSLKNSTSNTQVKKEYQEQIDNLNKVKGSYEDSDFESMASQIGKTGVYNTMFQDKVLDGYLDAYSYGPKVVETKIDEVQKFNLEYGLKLKTLAETQRHNKATEDVALLKAGATKEGKETGEGAFNLGAKQEVDSDKERNSILSQVTKQNQATYNVLKSSLSKQGLSEADIQSKDFQLALKQNKHLGKTIEVNGKTVTMTKDLRRVLNTHKENVIETPPEKERAFRDLDQMVKDVQVNLRYAVKTKNTDLESLPEFYVRHKKNPNTGAWTLERLRKGDKDYESVKNRYRYLVQNSDKQNKWTEKDKKDFKLYTTLQLRHDTALSTESRSLLSEKLYNEVSPYLDVKGLQILTKPEQGAYMENTRDRWRDKELSDIGRRDVKSTGLNINDKTMSKQDLEQAIVSLRKQQAAGGEPMDIGSIFMPSTQEVINEYQDRLNKGKYFKSDIKAVNDIVKAGFKSAEGHLEAAGISRVKEFNSQPYTIAKNKQTLDKYNKTAALAGFDSSGGKDISILPVLNDGVPTGKVRFTTLVKGEKGKLNRVYSEPVEAEKVKEAGIAYLDLGGNTKSKYNATSPYARPISLGNGIYSQVGPVGLPSSTGEGLKNRAKTVGYEKEVTSILNAYKSGDLEGKLEPIEGNYYLRFYQDGKLALGGLAVPASKEYTNEDINDKLDNPKPLLDWGLEQVINQLLGQ